MTSKAKEVIDQTSPRPVTIGLGGHGKIQIDPESMLVSKLFHESGAEDASELACREFRLLERFTPVLATRPYIHCPEPISVHPEEGRLLMTHVSGHRLETYLTDSHDFAIDEHLDHIAQQIALAIEDYIREFQHPYYSLGSENMLYDPLTGVLSLIDLLSINWRQFERFGPSSNMFEVSVGAMVGRSILRSVRFEVLANQHAWNRTHYLLSGVLGTLMRRHQLSITTVMRVSRHTYSYTAAKDRRVLRRAWYASFGRVIGGRRLRNVIAGSRRFTVSTHGS